MWVIMGDSRDHDDGSQWLVGVYATESDAKTDEKVLWNILVQYRFAIKSKDYELNRDAINEEYRRQIARIDEQGSYENCFDITYEVYEAEVRSAIGAETNEEKEAIYKARREEIKSKLNQFAKDELLAFYDIYLSGNKKSWKGLMNDKHEIDQDRQLAIDVLVHGTKLLVYPIPLGNGKFTSYQLTNLGKQIAMELLEEQ